MTSILYQTRIFVSRSLERLERLEQAVEHYDMTLGTFITGGALAIASLLLATVPEPPTFSATQTLFAVCLAGGIGGGLMAVLLFPLTKIKDMAFKWLGSSLAAALFGPATCQHYDIQGDISKSLAASGAIGLTSWAVLIAVVPMVSGIAKWFVKKWVPDAFKDESGVIQPRKPDWIDPKP